MSDREDYREVFKKSPLPKAVLKALGSTGVFSEHLKMKKKNQKIGFRAFISDKRQYLPVFVPFLSQRICFLKRSNDFYLSAQA